MLKRRVNGRQRISQRVKPSLAVEQSQGEEKRVFFNSEERSEEEKSVKERRAKENLREWKKSRRVKESPGKSRIVKESRGESVRVEEDHGETSRVKRDYFGSWRVKENREK